MKVYVSFKKHFLEWDLEAIARDCYNQFACNHKMCRLYCPVAAPLGNESYAPYGFHVAVLSIARGIGKLEDLLDTFTYCTECTSCEIRCPNTLFTGDFYKYTTTTADLVRTVRRQLYAKGLRLKNWEKVEEYIRGLETASKEDLTAWSRGLEVKRGVKSDVVLLVDTFTALRFGEVARDMAILLKEAGVDFTVVEPEKPVIPEYLSYDIEKFKQSVIALIENIKKLDAKKVIVINPHLYTILVREVPKYLGLEELPFEVVAFLDYLLELFKAGKLEMRNKVEMKAFYHDPCNFSKTANVFKSPRELLKMVPGLQFAEEHVVTQWRYCCGLGSYVFKYANPDESLIVGRNRVERIMEYDVDTIVTACPHCTEQFQEVTNTFKMPLKVVPITEVLRKAVKG